MTARVAYLVGFVLTVGFQGLHPRAHGQSTRSGMTPLADVTERGTGPVDMILIPAYGCDWQIYEEFMSRNQDRYRMYAVTLPGFAGSEPPPVPKGATFEDAPWLTNAERAIVQLTRQRSMEKPIVVGLSLGGNVAMRLAIRYPKLFRAAVILDTRPASRVGPPEQSYTLEERRQYVRAVMVPTMLAKTDEEWTTTWRQYAENMVRNETWARKLANNWTAVPRPTGIRYMAEVVSQDLTDDIKNVKIPVLFIAAIPEKDLPYGSRESLRKEWSAAIAEESRAELVFFENTRHFVTQEAPIKLDETVAEFMFRVSPKEPHKTGE